MRYNEQVNIQEVNPSGLSQVAQSHAANIRQFAESLTNTAGKFAGLYANKLQTDAKSDAEKDMTKGGVPEFRGGKGIGAQTYDGLMRESYAHSILADAVTDFNVLENESTSLADYSAKRESIFSALNKTIDGETLKAVMPKIQEMDQKVSLRLQDKELKLNKSNAQSDLLNAADVYNKDILRAFERGDPDEVARLSPLFHSAVEQLKASDPFTYNNEWESKTKTEAAKGWSNQNVYREIDQATAKGLDAGFAKLNELASKTPAGYTPEEWDGVLSKKVTELNAMEREQRRLAKENAKAFEQQSLENRGQEILANGYTLDPYRTDEEAKNDVKAYNAFYEKNYNTFLNLSPVDRVNANAALINRSGVIPSRVESNFNKAVAAGSTDAVVEQAELYARIQQETPQANQQLPAETRAILEIVNATREAGGDTEEAIKAARKFSYGMSQSEKDAIKLSSADYTKENGKELFKGLNNSLKDDFDSAMIFNNAPDAPDAMKAEYRNSFESKMALTGGNAELAQKLAYQDLKKVWGVTDVGGERRMMKFAPEAVYGVHGADNSWIKEQFETETTAAGLQGAVLSVNPHTVMRQGRPVYDVMAVNPKTGILDVVTEVDKSGKLVKKQWIPDYTMTEEYKIANNKPGDDGKILTAIENRKRKLEYEFTKGVKDVQSRGNVSQGGADLSTIEGINTAIQNSIVLGKASEGDRERLTQYFMEKNNAVNK